MVTPRKNANKDGICLLGSRPIDQKQRIIIFKHRDETEVSKILQKFKDDVFIWMCCAYLDGVYSKCVSRKGKKLTNLTNTPKSRNAVPI